MNPYPDDRSLIWGRQLARCSRLITDAVPLTVEGKLTRMVGLTLEASGCQAAIGEQCRIIGKNGVQVEAEVVGFSGEKTYLMPTTELRGLLPNARVIPTNSVYEAIVGQHLLGRVLDGNGEPLDGGKSIKSGVKAPITGNIINPLLRAPIVTPLDVGVRSINALLSVGRGQRLGLFAGSGVGKSVLLGMMTRYTSADVIVVGLIGERGREVNEFINDILGKSGRERAVVVATPADRPPLLRIHGAMLATAIAEHFRDQGKHVLLLMDSLTRYAQAQREIGLAIGEPPATKGYPPSAFAKIPILVERAGNGAVNGGSITAFYTVLTESDDLNDPIADVARAVLDGHIVLSRSMADSGHFPAIDVLASISRSATHITNSEHQELVKRFKTLYSTYQQNKDLISVGAYTKGSDARIDEAIDYMPRLNEFLRQDIEVKVNYQDSLRELSKVIK